MNHPSPKLKLMSIHKPRAISSIKNWNLANLLSLLRLLSGPIIVWMLLTHRYTSALVLFVLAGLTDALDGIAARFFKTKTTLGAYLDPLADKILVGCVYITLGSHNFIPLWLMILVISRDCMILGGIVLTALFHHKPLNINPIFISKMNTVLQLSFVFFILIDLSLIPLTLKTFNQGLCYAIGVTTILSGSLYVRFWLRHMNS